MADLIKKIKIKKQDGTFTDYIPIGAEAQNISTSDGDSVQLKLNNTVYIDNIVDNLDSSDSDKPLSANMGKELNNKFKQYFKVTPNMSQQKIQSFFNTTGDKIIEFETGNYLFGETFKLNKNTKIILNNAILTFNVDRAFYNFNTTDEFLEYNGNGNIEIVGGKIVGGSIRFCHARNISFKNIDFSRPRVAHLLEMAAINGLSVSNCTFDGQTTDKRYVETIQIDDMTRENFPWFDDADNPTYDNTPNTNWEIEHCKFFNSDPTNYVFHTAIGGHTFVENSYHTNIYIHHNEFEDFDYAGVHLKNNKNCVIENNKFKCGIASDMVVMALFIENTAENIKFNNNIVDGNINSTSRLVNAPTFVNNLEITNNKVNNFMTQQGATVTDKNILMRITDSNTIIKNNIFDNFDKQLLYIINGQQGVNSSVVFDGNIIKNTTYTGHLALYYGILDVKVINNTFDITTVSSIVRIGPYTRNLYIKNNNIDIVLKQAFLDLNGYAGSFANVSGVLFVGASVDNTTLTNQTLDVAYSDFDTALVDCGYNNENLTQFKLQRFARNAKLFKATYKLVCSDKNDNVGVATIVLNEDGTLNFSSTNSLHFRAIKFINES